MHIPPNRRPIMPPPQEKSLLEVINELNQLQRNCGCSLGKIQIALNHLKAIKGVVDNENKTSI